jgi:hypothetical protein
MGLKNSTLDPYLIKPSQRGQELADLSASRQIQAGHIEAHHASESLYAARAKLVNDMRLSDAQKRNITPFPTPVSTNITHVHNEGMTELLAALIDKLIPQAVPTPTPPATPDPPAKPPKPCPPLKVEVGTGTKPPVTAPLPIKTPKRPRSHGLLAFLTGLGLAGGTAWALWPDSPEPVDPQVPPPIEEPVEPPVKEPLNGEIEVIVR